MDFKKTLKTYFQFVSLESIRDGTDPTHYCDTRCQNKSKVFFRRLYYLINEDVKHQFDDWCKKYDEIRQNINKVTLLEISYIREDYFLDDDDFECALSTDSINSISSSIFKQDILKDKIDPNNPYRYFVLDDNFDKLTVDLETAEDLNVNQRIKNKIMSTNFMSDRKFTFVEFFKDIQKYTYNSQVLYHAKKCFVRLINRRGTPYWYGWDGDNIVRLHSLDCWTFSIRGRLDINLSVYLTEKSSEYNFIKGVAEITKMNGYVDIFPSHSLSVIEMFLIGYMDRLKVNVVTTGKYLYEEYMKWKKQKLVEVIEGTDLHKKLISDTITNSGKLTKSIHREASKPHLDKFYRTSTGNNNWKIIRSDI